MIKLTFQNGTVKQVGSDWEITIGDSAPSPVPAPIPSLSWSPPALDGLVTNEYAHWNPSDPKSKIDPVWDMTSGSLFGKGGFGYTGKPDNISPNPISTNGTDSSIFRLNTKRFDFGDIAVSMKVIHVGYSTSTTTPAVAWDGMHVFLRYQSEFWLYYASFCRRDNTCVIKKKCVGGTDNGGTYYELTPYNPFKFTTGVEHDVRATIKNSIDGKSLAIQLYVDNVLIAACIDNGTVGKCGPIVQPGAVGIRGDNSEFTFRNFTVMPL